jgi:hypothetical protein
MREKDYVYFNYSSANYILKKQLKSRKLLDEAELSSEKKLTLSSECLISRKMRKMSSERSSLSLKQHKNRKRARFAMMKREARDDGVTYVSTNKKGHV